MAGSLKWLNYTDDEGQVWAYRGDESNLESLITATGSTAGTGDYIAGATNIYSIPRNLKPRTALFRNASGTVSRRIIVPTAGVFTALAAGQSYTDDTSGETVVFVSRRGEELTVPFAQDTGLNDGDAT